MFFRRVNNKVYNIKQNIYTGMKIISLIPPWYYIKKVTSRNDVSREITNFQRDPFLKVHS